MNILLWVILGAVAGWIADMIMKSDHGVVEDIILGVVGAFVGGFILNFGVPRPTDLANAGRESLDYYVFYYYILFLVFLKCLARH